MAKDRRYAIEIMKQLSLPLEFKAYWNFRETSDVTCMETDKTMKTMHCSETWINLIYIDFYTLLTLVSYRKLVPHKAEIPGWEGE